MPSSKRSPLFSHNIKVRYAETDQMGIVHHSVYVVYLEAARTELWDSIGYPYSVMEKEGFIVPVVSVNIRYIRPAYYGDIITVNIMDLVIDSRIKFHYEYEVVRNGELLATATTEHVFVNEKFRPIRIPEKFLKIIEGIKSGELLKNIEKRC